MPPFWRKNKSEPAPAQIATGGAISNDATGINLSDIEELSSSLGIVNSMAGPVVNSRTATQLAIVYACTRLISGAIASLPLPIYKDGDVREKAVGHPVSSLLNLQPTPVYSAAMYWEHVTSQMLLGGDSHALILRDGMGQPTEFLPLNNMQPEKIDGRLVYFVELEGVWRGFDQGEVLHFPGFGFNGLKSLSVIQHAARNSIGLGIVMEQYSSQFFKDGAHQSLAIVKNGKWDAEDQENFRQAYGRVYGGMAKSNLPLTISKALEIKELSVNAADSQLLEGRKFQITDIARAFGLPGFMVNDSDRSTTWGTGMAEISLGFIRYTLQPHLNRFQQELNRKLFLNTPYFVEFNTAGLLRGTTKERYEAYGKALGGSNVPGFMAINEVRKIENLPPIHDAIYDQPYDPRMVITEQQKNA